MFVPLGFIAPYIMKAKLLLQLLCSRKCGWDDQLGEDEQNQWTRWREDLPKLVEVKFSRCFNPDVNGRIHVAFGIERTQPPCCINNKHFQTFESNRLMIIHSESYPKEWRYVNRDVNPADDGSKGLKLDAFLKDDRWIRGPQFLGKDESS